jgi:hypothetical protein
MDSVDVAAAFTVSETAAAENTAVKIIYRFSIACVYAFHILASTHRYRAKAEAQIRWTLGLDAAKCSQLQTSSSCLHELHNTSKADRS